MKWTQPGAWVVGATAILLVVAATVRQESLIHKINAKIDDELDIQQSWRTMASNPDMQEFGEVLDIILPNE